MTSEISSEIDVLSLFREAESSANEHIAATFAAATAELYRRYEGHYAMVADACIELTFRRLSDAIRKADKEGIYKVEILDTPLYGGRIGEVRVLKGDDLCLSLTRSVSKGSGLYGILASIPDSPAGCFMQARPFQENIFARESSGGQITAAGEKDLGGYVARVLFPEPGQERGRKSQGPRPEYAPLT